MCVGGLAECGVRGDSLSLTLDQGEHQNNSSWVSCLTDCAEVSTTYFRYF